MSCDGDTISITAADKPGDRGCAAGPHPRAAEGQPAQQAAVPDPGWRGVPGPVSARPQPASSSRSSLVIEEDGSSSPARRAERAQELLATLGQGQRLVVQVDLRQPGVKHGGTSSIAGLSAAVIGWCRRHNWCLGDPQESISSKGARDPARLVPLRLAGRGPRRACWLPAWRPRADSAARGADDDLFDLFLPSSAWRGPVPWAKK